MKSGFFYGVFAGFILGCLFFFGMTSVRAEGTRQGGGQMISYYYDTTGDDGNYLAYGGQGYHTGGSWYGETKRGVYGDTNYSPVGGTGYLGGGLIG